MTFDELFDECWASMPLVRKHLAGQDQVRQWLGDAVSEWDSNAVMTCQGDEDMWAYEDALIERVQARNATRQEYGFVLLTILATAVLVAVVQWLVKKWLDNHFGQEQVAAWQQEIAT